MKILPFQPRFAALVKSGAKRQTIRPFRRRLIHLGDELNPAEVERRARNKMLGLCFEGIVFRDKKGQIAGDLIEW